MEQTNKNKQTNKTNKTTNDSIYYRIVDIRSYEAVVAIVVTVVIALSI
jgi:hypothetical protein